ADLERARARGLDVIGAEVKLKRVPGGLHAGCCVFHHERTPSFYVYPDGHFHCFGCGAHGDAINFVMRLRGLAFQAAIASLLDMPERYQIVRTTRLHAPAPRENDSGTADRVRAILAECGPVVDGTAAWLYLWSRGLKPSPALLAHPALFCSEIGGPLPALVAPLVGGLGETSAVQRIWCKGSVEYDGTNCQADARAPLVTRKKTLGVMSDGAVRLQPAGAVLGLAEGVETALAASQLYRVPVWAVCGAARLGHVAITPDVKILMIFGDNGATGHDLAERAAALWRERGMACQIAYPPERFGDFNDMVRG
ncbi:MAG: CHC2 zinc finger domain-containing protein, partial [Pseudomonadota bacterium]